MTGDKKILSSDVAIKGKVRFSRDLITDGRNEGSTDDFNDSYDSHEEEHFS